jgi:hypothetical protein
MQTKTLQHIVTFKASPQEVLRHVDGFGNIGRYRASLPDQQGWVAGLQRTECNSIS